MNQSRSERVTLDPADTFMLLAAIGLGVIWTINSVTYAPTFVGLLIVGIFNTLWVIHSHPYASRLTCAYVVAVGFADRIVRSEFPGSDVINATLEAVQLVLSKHNPYFHFFMTTLPPGSPFPYFPGEILFYVIPYKVFHSIDAVDKFSGIAILFLLIALAPIVGPARAALCTALYAVFSMSAVCSVGGSNDTSLAFLTVLSIVLLIWSEHTGKQIYFYASAVFFAWALLFKALSWPFAPFLFLYLLKRDRASAQRYAIVTCGFFFFLLAPFLLPSPSGVFQNFYRGMIIHDYIGGLNVWSALLRIGIWVDPRTFVIPTIEISVAGVFLLILLRRQGDSLCEALLCGLLVLMTLLLLTRWSTMPYFTYAGIIFITAITCITKRPIIRQPD